jgi:cell division protein FtsZ
MAIETPQPIEAVAPVAAPPPIAQPAAPPVAAAAAPSAAPPVVVGAPAAPAAAASSKPLVDETDWRVTRPAAPRQPVRATEPLTARPMAARPATSAESRAPNLFQRITGAFSAPKGLTPVVNAIPAPTAHAAEPPMVAPRPVAENVVSVAAKPAARPAAPVQTSISLDAVSERARPAREDDDLQIPAFLRRQAN